MSDAIVFISRNRVLPGKPSGLRAFLAAPELPAGFLRTGS